VQAWNKVEHVAERLWREPDARQRGGLALLVRQQVEPSARKPATHQLTMESAIVNPG
jgi:hypothetical protein